MSMNHHQLLRERFGLAAFRPGQLEVLRALEIHGGALAVFPTGGGKSLCYQLPALGYEGVTVVVSPLIALMKDQIDVLVARGIAAARLDSSLTRDEALAVSRQLRSRDLKLLYVAPERFNNERFLDQLGGVPISLFAVDEAHCISEWGHNFRPDYLKLAGTARALGAERVLTLTATATPPVIADICQAFRIPPEAAVVTAFHRPNLFLSTAPLPPPLRATELAARVASREPGSTIVYVTLQATAEKLAEQLAGDGISARAYHAGMEDAERTAVQEWWRSSDRNVVVATIAFGMGIDKAEVRYVYHYNLPKGLESYAQEIGRAGRDGRPALVEILGSSDDLVQLEKFVYGDTPTATALRGLVGDLLTGGEHLELNIQSLASEHDIRPLVVRTALTYLELAGVLKQGTPFYAGYKVRPSLPISEIVGQFSGERARFVEAIFDAARRGREWYSMNPADVAIRIGSDRARIVRALDYLAERGWVDLKVSDARQRFTRVVDHPDVDGIALGLATRFEQREIQEIGRIARVAELVSHPGCQTNYLLGYLGEQRAGPCGHCTFCQTGSATELSAAADPPPIDTLLDRREVLALSTSHSDALGQSRQLARFLCGISSPAVTRARLSRNPLYGRLLLHRFPAVEAWCASLAPAEQAPAERVKGPTGGQDFALRIR